MKIFIKSMVLGIVLVISSCVKDELVESDFISMYQKGNVVELKTNLSSMEVVLNTEKAEACEQIDTITREVYSVENQSAWSKISWIETGKIVKQIRNFKVVEKKYKATIYLPIKKKNKCTEIIETQFNFVTEVPILNDECVLVYVDVDCDFVKFEQDPEHKEQYSTATYCFHLTVIQNDQEVEHFSFERDFLWENTPITFAPTVDDWEPSTEDVNP